MKKYFLYLILYLVGLLLFTISWAVNPIMVNTATEDTVIQAQINLLNERIQNYDLRWQKVSALLSLRDIYYKINRVEEAIKAEEEAYREKERILSAKLDSNDAIGTFITFIGDNRHHKKWDTLYDLTKTLIDLIDSGQISTAYQAGYFYPNICGDAAEALLSMNKPDEAMFYIEKGLAWTGESYYKSLSSEVVTSIHNGKLNVRLIQAEVYMDGYKDFQSAKRIYDEILSTYSDITVPGSKYRIRDKNRQLKDVYEVIKENLNKIQEKEENE